MNYDICILEGFPCPKILNTPPPVLSATGHDGDTKMADDDSRMRSDDSIISILRHFTFPTSKSAMRVNKRQTSNKTKVTNL